MKEFIGQMVVATCEGWFYDGNGNQYRSIYGKLESIVKIDENTLGFTPNRPNVNWVYKIGDVFIHGCQIKYIILCPKRPTFGELQNWDQDKRYKTPNTTYDAS